MNGDRLVSVFPAERKLKMREMREKRERRRERKGAAREKRTQGAPLVSVCGVVSAPRAI